MVSAFSIRLVVVLVGLANLALGDTLVLNFDDVSISNEASCGSSVLTFGQHGYHGIFVSSGFSERVTILNTTKTAACSSSSDEPNGLSPFGFATSAPNVAAVPNGLIEFQTDVEPNTPTVAFVGNATLSVSFGLTQAQVDANITITLMTLFTDFANVFEQQTFTFFAANGLGPYEVEVANNDVALLLEVETLMSEPGPFEQFIYIDNVTFETALKDNIF
ncbi:hypothetical protein GQ53DRAFT_805367 [Thozetella sp. PMI_491]|nr:hypothetical protein GQ53DRAFT_805367 [Thozetella sp. PMI_491]